MELRSLTRISLPKDEYVYLLEFIKLNNKLSDLLHKYRGY